MKAHALLIATLAIGCSKSVEEPKAEEEILMSMAPEPAEVEEEKPEVKPEPAPKPKPKNNFTEGRCRKLLHQFDQCGWRCAHRGGNPGRCVQVCRHLLNKTRMRCLRIWGPGFG